MLRKCYFCNKNFETSFRNHGCLYKGKKIFICNECIFKEKECKICGKIFMAHICKYDTTYCCSKECGRILSGKITSNKMKEENIGPYSEEGRKLRSKLMKDRQYKIHEIEKEKRVGIYSKEFQRKVANNKKILYKENENYRNNLNKILIKARNIQKENKLGVYNSEFQKNMSIKASEKIKNNLKEKFKDLKININLVEKDIISIADYDSFEKYYNVPGVWSIFGSKDNKEFCLDICQTKDIGREMKLGMRKLAAQKLDKYKKIKEFNNITFKIIEINIYNQEEREKIEAQYYSKTHALFWSPSPLQKQIYK